MDIAQFKQKYDIPEDTEVGFKNASLGTVFVDEDGSFEAKITSDAVDNDLEVLLPQGLNPSYFESCGAWYWDHRYDLPPVASNLGVKQGKNYWMAKGQFAQRPEGYEGEYFPQLIQSLVEQRVIRGVSVGFSIQERRNPTAKDKATFGEHVKSVVSKWSLKEVSLTALPCNPEALLVAVKNAGCENYKAYFPSLDLPETLIPEPEEDEPVELPEHIPGTEECKEDKVIYPKKVILLCGYSPPAPKAEEPLDIKSLVAQAVAMEMKRLRGRVYL